MASSQHVRFMDGLRGIAVLMVTTFHMHGLGMFPCRLADIGFLGIDVFFFLSGFALFYPYAQHLFEARPLQTLQTYAHRRASKIFPSYFIALTTLTLIYPLWLDPPDSRFMHWLKHALFIHNFWHASTMSISGPFWTLAVEVQFYVLFPLIAPFLMRAPIWTTVLLCTLSSVYRMHLQLEGIDVLGPGYQLPAYLDLFIFGSLASYLIVFYRSQSACAPRGRSCWNALAYPAVMLFAVLLHTCEHSDHGIWHTDFAGILGIALLIMCVGIAQSASFLRRALENRIFVWFSGISYNMYLWHVSILFWLRTHPLLAFCTILAVAWVSTECIERPIMRIGLFSFFGICARKVS